jgi:hypothetical protein
VDVPPQDQQAPSLPAVPAQRPGDDALVAPPPSTPPARRRRNWRLILAVFLGMLAPALASGSLIVYLLYDRATAPDLGTPTGAVRQYLDAYLGSRDNAQAAMFACGGNADLVNVKAARDDIVSREKQYGVSIRVSVQSVTVTSQSGHDADVGASITLTTAIEGTSQRAVEQWTFHAREDGGWRVCDGHEVG